VSCILHFQNVNITSGSSVALITSLEFSLRISSVGVPSDAKRSVTIFGKIFVVCFIDGLDRLLEDLFARLLISIIQVDLSKITLEFFPLSIH